MNSSEAVKLLVNQWIKKANEDLTVAKRELLYIDEELFPSTICFHAQQAVEKYLKAFLIFHQIEFPRTHNLEELRKICSSKIDISFSILEIGNLTDYAIVSRYPDEPAPTLEEATEAVKVAQQVKIFILPKINY